jgi:sterol desaturase/sphingolipid hydroxylase (fatty acid hydroxylase superfamily)
VEIWLDIGRRLAPLAPWLVSACLFLTLSCLVKGRAAFRWSEGLLRSVRSNLFLAVTNAAFVGLAAALAGAVRALLAHVGAPWITAPFWHGVPLALSALAALLLFDLVNYWNHRWMHTRWLWGFHAVHHSDPDMNWTTTYRVHALEGLFMIGTLALLAGWVGFPPQAVALAALIGRLHNNYVHCALGWSHGWFDRVIASPQLHRWHHSEDPAVYGKNLANIFSFYDVMFGTYHNPGPCTDKLGFADSPAHHPLGLLLYPFRYWGEQLGLVKRRAAAGAGEGANAFA